MNKRANKEFIAALNLGFEVPKHVGIIMDGNGRWAAMHSKPRALGHRAGMERLHGIVKTASDLGIDALSLYAFSTENWSRPALEVNALMNLLIEFFDKEIDELNRNGVLVRHLGELSGFGSAVRSAIERAVDLTKGNDGMSLNLALNYGSRAEIVAAARSLARDAVNGSITPDNIDEAVFAGRLSTCSLPDLDLVIRTSGEMRLSNFLLYQAAYSEFVFVPEHWPDFSDERFIAALREYGSRGRRFGKV